MSYCQTYTPLNGLVIGTLLAVIGLIVGFRFYR